MKGFTHNERKKKKKKKKSKIESGDKFITSVKKYSRIFRLKTKKKKNQAKMQNSSFMFHQNSF